MRPIVSSVLARRYRCQACAGVIVVVPAEVLPGRLYTASALALAFALFGVLRQGARAVRAQISPWSIVGQGTTGWATLRRWLRAVRDGLLWRCVRPAPATWPGHKVAERAAGSVAAHAPPGKPCPPMTTAAFIGAARAR